ncbi:thiamine/thiamine pyrophosphate ABC transporter permease ThiP [Faunimonas sp. B44]|uniref:thiamine/thiamine pyrophosphate ABC transporter permease ThiP n=1 Tax=Faunimonas sp. B44 TaxID=3461493 RepID=UPI004044488A
MGRLPGVVVLVLVFGIVAAALGGLAAAAGPESADLPWRYVGRVLAFSVGQAALSTVLSLLLGAALALALARRARFPGRDLFVAALNLATVLPAIVAVFGIVAVLGRSGWAGTAARFLGFEYGSWLYGLPGILVAHVFFNAPLAARIFLGSLSAVPAEHWRLAAQLGMPAGAVFRIVDRPVLFREAPALGLLIFLLCFTSFAIVLALGGGPRASTLEVAIYEAVRFEADLGRAGLLAAIQIAICLAIAVPVLAAARRPPEMPGAALPAERPDTGIPALKALDGLVLALGAALVLPPLAAILVSGVAGLSSLAPGETALALVTSVAIAVPAGLLATLFAVALADLARRLRGGARGDRAADAIGLVGLAALAIPPVALSAGLFVALRPVVNPFAFALPLIVLVNALMALPFALRQVEPPLALSAERYGRLADSLGIAGAARIRIVDWPLLRRPFLVALGISSALSLGDLGVAAFFGSGNLLTLPLLLHQLMGAYRMEAAASVSLLLASLVLAIFLAAQRWSGDALA